MRLLAEVVSLCHRGDFAGAGAHRGERRSVGESRVDFDEKDRLKKSPLLGEWGQVAVERDEEMVTNGTSEEHARPVHRAIIIPTVAIRFSIRS